MEILKGDKIAELFAANNKTEIAVVEQFLALLNIMMSFPGSTFQSYVTHILKLTVEIYPHVAEKEGFIGVKEAIFQVLYMILLTHLNHCQDQELQLAMKAFHYSFQRLSDLSIFKKNLHFLADLNKRIKLFSKEFFVKDWRNVFLQTFFKVLFDGMHRILEDDIIPVIFELASVDLNSFFIKVLPGLIAGLSVIPSPVKADILMNFSRDTDMPTFSRNMQQMVGSPCTLNLLTYSCVLVVNISFRNNATLGIYSVFVFTVFFLLKKHRNTIAMKRNTTFENKQNIKK